MKEAWERFENSPAAGLVVVAIWCGMLIGLLWAYMHHFCAGIRFLLLDLHKGTDLQAARNSSRIVLVVSIALTVIIGVKLW